MEPSLVVLAGLPERVSVPLRFEGKDEFVLGRSSECDLPIGRSAVSRKHCRITRERERYRLDDLNSHNGTFVNGLPVKTRYLVNNDRVVIGDSCVLFVTELPASHELTSIEFDDGSVIARSFHSLAPELETVDFTADANALAKFGRAITETRDVEALKERFLEVILELIPARIAVIIIALSDSEFHSTLACSESSGSSEPVKISQTVCRKVIEEQVALVSNEIEDTGLSESESLIHSGTCSLLCVPIKVGSSAGLIYLDSSDPAIRFDVNHLHQLTAFSFIVSAALENANSISRILEENSSLREASRIETSLIGESKPIRDVLDIVSRVAPTDATVLICGESGTGKELIAKAIHSNSFRRERPFVAINCAILSESLLESELFGFEKGAFTGAMAQKKGKFELADGGTLFLDEVGELQPNLQSKLLRVLQEREFERIGGIRPIKTDIRVVAATNRLLEEAVKDKAFREDLFFRLNVVRIKMPPLRERTEDVPLLTQHFIRKFNDKCHRQVAGTSERTRILLRNYGWPGNVRELENVIERAIVLGTSSKIETEDLPSEIVDSGAAQIEADSDFHKQVKNAKKLIVGSALKDARGNYSGAAKILGLHPNNLHRLIRNLGMKDRINNDQ